MREIKFRGKQKQTSEWIYGDLWQNKINGVVHTACIKRGFGDSPDEIRVSTIGQYTCLKDKNGKFIYEGDILKSMWQHDGIDNYDYEVIGQVIYDLEFNSFRLIFWNNKQNTKFSYPLYSFEREELLDDEFEIIGNVHDNPELTQD